MIGLIVGTVCLVLLIAQVTRHRRGWYGHYAFHPGAAWYGHGRHRHRHRGPGFYGPGSRRAVLYDVLARLDTTPGQDRVILDAVDNAGAQLREVREPLFELRRDLGAALSADAFERSQIEALFTRAEGRLRDARGGLVDALERVHGALEPEQRKRLGKLVGQGGGGPFGAC